MLFLEDFIISYICKNIQNVIFGFILLCFVIDYLIYKNQINSQIMCNKKIECKFHEVIKYMKRRENEMDLMFEKYENYIQTLDSQLMNTIKQTETHLINMANYTDSLFEKHQLEISNMKDKLSILFSENISKIEQKFIQYIEDCNEERKSIYCFYKTASDHKVFNGSVSSNDIIDAIFNHYFDITFDEEKDIIDKQIIIDSFSNETKEKIKSIEISKKIIEERMKKNGGDPFGY
jgi:predicted nuclease with TOPRIM domain